MSSPRCVVDTNVLISAGLTPAGTSRRVLDWIVDHGQLLLSAETLAEFATRFVSRAKFDRYASPETRSAFVAAVAVTAETVPVTSSVSVCPDPDDDRFLELAVDGRADCVVTGNTRDFPSEYEGIRVLTPAEFVRGYLHG